MPEKLARAVETLSTELQSAYGADHAFTISARGEKLAACNIVDGMTPDLDPERAKLAERVAAFWRT